MVETAQKFRLATVRSLRDAESAARGSRFPWRQALLPCARVATMKSVPGASDIPRGISEPILRILGAGLRFAFWCQIDLFPPKKGAAGRSRPSRGRGSPRRHERRIETDRAKMVSASTPAESKVPSADFLGSRITLVARAAFHGKLAAGGEPARSPVHFDRGRGASGCGVWRRDLRSTCEG